MASNSETIQKCYVRPTDCTYPGNASAGDLIRLPNTANGALRGAGSLDLYPSFAAAASGVDRPVIVDSPMGVAVGTAPAFSIQYIAASSVWRLVVGGVTVNSGAQAFTAGQLVQLAWSYAVGGQACLTVDGSRTCGGTVSSFTPGSFLTLGSYGSATNTPVTFLAMAAQMDGGFAGSVKNVVLGPTTNPGPVRTAIAVLGDSLTYGKTAAVTTPYPLGLQGLLGTGYFVDNHGISGQLFHGDSLNAGLHSRYWRDIQGYPYAAVVVLGGTNDVNSGRTAVQTEPWIQSIYDSVRADGKLLVPLTIPPSSTFTAPQKTERAAINTWILNYCTANGVTCVDIATDLDDGTGALKAIYNSGDNLHLNQAGYDRVATLIRAALPY